MLKWLGRAITAATGWAPTDDRWYTSGWGGTPTQAGVTVNEDKALTYVALFSIVNKYSKTFATLPGHVIERVNARERVPVDDHPLNDLLSVEANPDTTGITLLETMMLNALLWGAGYAEIGRSNYNTGVQWLLPLMSRDITPEKSPDGSLVFQHRPQDGEHRTLPADRVLHVPGLSINGITGISVVGYIREAIGLGMAATDMAASYYGNNSFMGGFLLRDKDAGKLSPEAGSALVADLERKFKGAKNAGGITLLREGMTYKEVGIPLVDAELLASRNASVLDMCMALDMPPSKIHQLKDGGKWNNMEEQNISWATDSLRPWCVRFETAIRKQLLPPGKLRYRFNLAGLQRGAFKDQMEGLVLGLTNGILSSNDCRTILDMNPLPGPGGNRYRVPLNLVDIDATPIQPTQPDDDPEQAAIPDCRTSLDVPSLSGPGGDTLAVFRPLVHDVAARVAQKEIKAVEGALARLTKNGNVGAFQRWAETFYDKQAEYLAACVAPIAESYATATGAEPDGTIAKAAAELYADESFDTVTAIAEQPLKMAKVLDGWKHNKAAALASGIMKLLEERETTSTIIEPTE